MLWLAGPVCVHRIRYRLCQRNKDFCRDRRRAEVPQILPRPGWCCKSADHKLLFLARLDLEPLPGTAFFIRTIAVLGYYSFKPFALGNSVSGKAVRRQAAGKKQLPWWLSHGGFQFPPAPHKWFGPEISTVAVKAVEHCKAQGLIL